MFLETPDPIFCLCRGSSVKRRTRATWALQTNGLGPLRALCYVETVKFAEDVQKKGSHGRASG